MLVELEVVKFFLLKVCDADRSAVGLEKHDGGWIGDEAPSFVALPFRFVGADDRSKHAVAVAIGNVRVAKDETLWVRPNELSNLLDDLLILLIRDQEGRRVVDALFDGLLDSRRFRLVLRIRSDPFRDERDDLRVPNDETWRREVSFRRFAHSGDECVSLSVANPSVPVGGRAAAPRLCAQNARYALQNRFFRALDRDDRALAADNCHDADGPVPLVERAKRIDVEARFADVRGSAHGKFWTENMDDVDFLLVLLGNARKQEDPVGFARLYRGCSRDRQLNGATHTRPVKPAT